MLVFVFPVLVVLFMKNASYSVLLMSERQNLERMGVPINERYLSS
jgi:hypothetical protein